MNRYPWLEKNVTLFTLGQTNSENSFTRRKLENLHYLCCNLIIWPIFRSIIGRFIELPSRAIDCRPMVRGGVLKGVPSSGKPPVRLWPGTPIRIDCYRDVRLSIDDNSWFVLSEIVYLLQFHLDLEGVSPSGDDPPSVLLGLFSRKRNLSVPHQESLLKKNAT